MSHSMNRIIVSILLLCNFCAVFEAAPFKILHMSLHKGCINDFAEVAQELSLDCTNWYIHDSRDQFDPEAKGNDIYNITAERAKQVWQLNKEYFDEFDAIITSDTAPLSRIFLQNDWEKPLIIWICNRFDYHDGQSGSGKFPDKAYYDLFRAAIDKPNVKIISYTPYEHYYAHQKGVPIGTLTIRPIGCLPKEPIEKFTSAIPATIHKAETIFIYPRMSAEQSKHVQEKCTNVGITTYYSIYNGPDDLTDFKGVLYFPYAWSNLALFENIQRGIVHFVPTEQFVKEISRNEPIPHFTSTNFRLCDWYCDEYKDLFVYFDSWQDLQEKVKTTDYQSLHEKIKKAGLAHWHKNLDAWKDLFEELTGTRSWL